jgi:hypothetical protein
LQVRDESDQGGEDVVRFRRRRWPGVKVDRVGVRRPAEVCRVCGSRPMVHAYRYGDAAVGVAAGAGAVAVPGLSIGAGPSVVTGAADRIAQQLVGG